MKTHKNTHVTPTRPPPPAAYQATREKRAQRTKRYGCDATVVPVRRVVMSCLRTLPAIAVLFFMFLNWFVLNAPLWARASWVTFRRARTTAGAFWDRHMRYTNLTRNRLLVGTQGSN
jgi:hypothetical protein